MNCTLFFPYESYDENLSFNRFVPQNQQSDVNNQQIVDINNISSLENMILSNHQNERENLSYNNNTNNIQYNNNNFEKTVYTPIEIKLYDEYAEEHNFDKLLTLYRSQSTFMCIIEFNPDELNEDAEYELKLWLKNSNKILLTNNKYINSNNKFLALPPKDFKLMFDNKSCAILNESKLIELQDNRTFAISVKNITFVNN